jgi:uncharacterized LabA/DUF88 family protein
MRDNNNVAYIDNTNLHKGCEAEGFKIDYAKFRKYLEERLGIKIAYIFIGYVAGNEERYKKFQESGYTLIFKPTVADGNGKIKGNCDAELVLQAVQDVYENNYDSTIIVSSDGDFCCLVQFLQKKNKFGMVLSPRDKNKCSTLIKRFATRITFLPEVRHLIDENE